MRESQVAVFIHLVWATWDRLPLITEEIERPLHRAISAKCAELGVEVIALGGVEDHIHLLVRLPATLPLAELVKQVKGASAHLVTHEITPARSFKWQGAYGAFSVSLGHLDRISAYIAHQREHHAGGSLIAAWEQLPGSDNISRPLGSTPTDTFPTTPSGSNARS